MDYDKTKIAEMFDVIRNGLAEALESQPVEATTWGQDIIGMHDHYGVPQAVEGFDANKLAKLLEFRVNFLKEEMAELDAAIAAKDADGVVDSLIDLCVVAIGTLDIFQVEPDVAWQEVLGPNMSKEVGVKPERPNPLGLPDLVKPEGWVAPNHEDNLGTLPQALSGDPTQAV